MQAHSAVDLPDSRVLCDHCGNFHTGGHDTHDRGMMVIPGGPYVAGDGLAKEFDGVETIDRSQSVSGINKCRVIGAERDHIPMVAETVLMHGKSS